MIAMTRQEYVAKQQAMTRWQNRRMVWWFVMLFGGLAAMIAFARYVDRHPESAWMGNLYGGGLIVLLVVCVLWMLLTMRRVRREFGVKCRSCGKQILNSQIAIATGNCYYCGEKLFD
jgi:hypothetical protein